MAENELIFDVDITTQAGLGKVKGLIQEFQNLGKIINTQTGGIAKALDTLLNRSIAKTNQAQAAIASGKLNAPQLARATKTENDALREQVSLLKQVDSLSRRAQQAPQKAFTQVYGETTASTQKLHDKLSNFGGADFLAVQSRILLNYKLISGAYQAGSFLTKFVVDLDKNFHQLQAISASTDGTMAKLEDRLIKVSQASKFTAVEVSDAAVTMAQAGLSAREVAGSIDAVIKLATASGSDLKTSVDVVTSVLSVFDLQTGQTSEVANVLTSALNESKLTIDKFALGLQYSGNLAAESNVSYKELAALLGAISNSGIRAGSTLGTGLRQLFTDLLNPTQKFTETLKRIGLTLADVDPRTQTFVGVLNKLKEAGFTASDALASFEVRGANAFNALKSDDVLKLLESFTNTTAATKANETQMESLANVWARFTSVAGTFAAGVAPPALAALTAITKGATSLFVALQQIPLLLPAIGIGLTGIVGAGILGGLTKIVIGFKDLVYATAAWKTVLTGATAAAQGGFGLASIMSLIGGPWTLALAGLGVAAAGAFYFWRKSIVDLNKVIDESQTKVDKWQGEADSTTTTLESVRKETERTIIQFQALNDSPALRRARIEEIKDQFAGMGLQLDANTSSVNDLVAALEKLSVKLNADLVSTYGLELAQLNDLIDNLKKKLGEVKSEGRETLQIALNYAAGGSAQIGYGGVSITGRRGGGTQPITIPGFGPDLQSQFQQLQNPNNRLNINQTKDILASDTALRSRLDENSPLIPLLNAMIEVAGKQLEALQHIEVSSSQRDRVSVVSQTANLRTEPPIVSATAKLDAFETNTRSRLQSILTSKVSDSEKRDQLDALEQETEKALQGQKTRLEYFRFAASHGPNSEGAEKVFTEFTNRSAALMSEVSAKFEALKGPIDKARDLFNQFEIKNIDREIDYLLGRAKQSDSTSYVQSLNKIIEDLVNKKKKLVDQIFNRDHDKDHPANAEDIENARQKIDEIDQEAASYVQRLFEETQRIAKEAFDNHAKELQSRYDGILQSMKTLRDRNDPKQTVESVKAIGEELDILQKSLEATVKELQEVNVSKALAEAGIPSTVYGGFAPPPDYIKKRVETIHTKAQQDAEQQTTAGQETIETLFTKYLDAIVRQAQDRAKGPQADLDLTGNRVNEGKFGKTEIESRQLAVENSKRIAAQEEITKLTAEELKIEEQIAAIPHNGVEYTNLLTKQVEVQQRLNQAILEHKSLEESTYTQSYTDRIKEVTKAFLEQRGVVFNYGTFTIDKVQTALQQVGDAWNTVLSGLTTGFETFFTSIATGTSSAGEAFKAFGVSILQMLIQILAKATATQIALTLFGGEDGKGGLLSGGLDVVKNLLGGAQTPGTGITKTLGEALPHLASLTGTSDLPAAGSTAVANFFKNPATNQAIASAAAANPGVSSDYLNTVAWLESKGNPAAVSSTGATGLFQLTKGTAQDYGVINRFDPFANADGAARLTQVNQQGLTDFLGRVPTGAELYLAHQQGLTGAEKLFANPTANAASILGPKAITANGGTLDQTASQFTAQWEDNFNSINSTLSKTASDLPAATDQLVTSVSDTAPKLATGLTGAFDKTAAGVDTVGTSFVDKIGQGFQSIFSWISSLFSSTPAAAPTALGGYIPRRAATGGYVQGGIPSFRFTRSSSIMIPHAAVGEYVREGTPFRDSQLRLVMPGEFILRSSAVSQIGRKNLQEMNNLGNRRISESVPISRSVRRDPDTVNVWMVPQEQVPPPGPKDIIAAVAANIQNRGALKTLIKSVAVGY